MIVKIVLLLSTSRNGILNRGLIARVLNLVGGGVHSKLHQNLVGQELVVCSPRRI